MAVTSALLVSEPSASATRCRSDETPRPPPWRSSVCAPARSTYSPGWAWSPCASTSSRRRWYAWSGSSVEPAACRRGWWSDLSVVQVSLMQAFDGEPLESCSGRESFLVSSTLRFWVSWEAEFYREEKLWSYKDGYIELGTLQKRIFKIHVFVYIIIPYKCAVSCRLMLLHSLETWTRYKLSWVTLIYI